MTNPNRTTRANWSLCDLHIQHRLSVRLPARSAASSSTQVDGSQHTIWAWARFIPLWKRSRTTPTSTHTQSERGWGVPQGGTRVLITAGDGDQHCNTDLINSPDRSERSAKLLNFRQKFCPRFRLRLGTGHTSRYEKLECCIEAPLFLRETSGVCSSRTLGFNTMTFIML